MGFPKTSYSSKRSESRKNLTTDLCSEIRTLPQSKFTAALTFFHPEIEKRISISLPVIRTIVILPQSLYTKIPGPPDVTYFLTNKIYRIRQQAWEDNLPTLNAEDNSLSGELRKRSGSKPPRSPPLTALLTQRPPRKRKNPDSGAARVPPSSLHLPPISQSH
ncbi:hypothetical protein TNCV_1387171 [Trichonephila clavipes]|nr:hypothetical protein TNCV_1387171 [Trichonephila clavipes]